MATREHTYNLGVDKRTRKTLQSSRKRICARSLTETVRRQTEYLDVVLGLEDNGYVIVGRRADGSEQLLPPLTLRGRAQYLAAAAGGRSCGDSSNSDDSSDSDDSNGDDEDNSEPGIEDDDS